MRTLAIAPLLATVVLQGAGSGAPGRAAALFVKHSSRNRLPHDTVRGTALQLRGDTLAADGCIADPFRPGAATVALASRRTGRYDVGMRRHRASPLVLIVTTVVLAATALAAAPDAPSRKPVEKCTWEKLSDAKLGLAAWVQRCDFGFRRIDFVAQGDALAIRYSDGGSAPEPVVDVFALEPGETPEAGVKRIFVARTDAATAKRCVLAPWKQGRTPAGRARFTFVPDAAYARELKKKQRPDEVGEPPCGPYGDAPDGIQYFETQPKSGVAKVLFVRVGQDEPLFDEQTLRLLGPQ